MAPYEEAYWTFSRGPRYLEASLGLLLGWDAALVFRPAQALMLAMAVPATFLFCRQWVRTSMAVSLLASLLVGLNSTLYFWVYLGHPGQASWTFLLPVTLAVTLAALGTRDRAACAAAVLLLSAHFISYCQASPVLPGLVGTAFLYYLMLGRGYRWQLFGVATAIVAGVLVLAFPEHLKMLLTQIGTGMYQAVGWGDPRVGPLSDALGTTPSDVTVGLVSSKGQIDQTTVSTWQSVSSYISPIAYLFMAIGLAAGRGAGLSTYRAVLLGDLLLLGYLAITNYGYGYTKLLSMTTFLFCVALAAGMVEAWRWCRATLASRKLPVARALASAAVAVAAASVVFMATVNLGVLVSSYWKMDRNLFNTGLWDASALNRILPQEAVTKLSPALFAEPQTLFYANYFLRDQRVQGPVALEWIWRRLVLLPLDESATRDAKATFGLFGKGEIASIQGLSPQDRLWAGSLMKAYRFPAAEAETVREVRGAEGQLQSLPALLPATVELRPAEGSASTDGGDEGALVVSLLSQGSAQLRLSSSLGGAVGPDQRRPHGQIVPSPHRGPAAIRRRSRRTRRGDRHRVARWRRLRVHIGVLPEGHGYLWRQLPERKPDIGRLRTLRRPDTGRPQHRRLLLGRLGPRRLVLPPSPRRRRDQGHPTGPGPHHHGAHPADPWEPLRVPLQRVPSGEAWGRRRVRRLSHHHLRGHEPQQDPAVPLPPGARRSDRLHTLPAARRLGRYPPATVLEVKPATGRSRAAR